MFMTYRMLLWWTLDSTVTTRNKGSSAVEIRAASAGAKLRQSHKTQGGIELPMQLLHSC